MAWVTPKTDWNTDDGIMNTDLNRIEGNTQFINESLLKRGVSYYANNTTAGGGAYNIRVVGGNLFSQSAISGPMPGSFDIQKVLSSTVWAAGNATDSPCKCPDSAAIGAYTWWYVFVLYNPTTEAFDVCMDDNVAGSNIQGSAITTAGFTMWKRVACQFEEGVSSGLCHTIGLQGHFYTQAHDNDLRLTVNTGVVSGTFNLSMINSITAKTITPPGLSFPCRFTFDCQPSTFSSFLNVWSPLLGSTFTVTGGERFTVYSVSDGEGGYHAEYRSVTVIPDASDTIYVNTITSNGDIRFRVVGWIDEATD